jgi:hypothetical protein
MSQFQKPPRQRTHNRTLGGALPRRKIVEAHANTHSVGTKKPVATGFFATVGAVAAGTKKKSAFFNPGSSAGFISAKQGYSVK